jgi:hypothetical protein
MLPAEKRGTLLVGQYPKIPPSEKNGDNTSGSTLSANATVRMVEWMYMIETEVGLYHRIGGIGVTVE